jgi:NCAIR mutase (PurE)-related protein
MDQSALRQLLRLVQNGECPIDNALEKLRHFPLENIQDACIDHQRSLRTGMPEVIYGASKSAEQIIAIAQALLLHSGPVLATRVDPEKAQAVIAQIPELSYHPAARMLTGKAQAPSEEKTHKNITVVCAGSSDIPVAEEAVLTLESMGNAVNRIYDVGVAGLHRLLAHRPLFDRSSVIIAVAGMEGALPGVIAGLVQCPVIGVPTSVGYGTSFGGVAALLGMLNSCAPGLAVVNIDNGFGAACMAHAINMQKNR